MTNTQPEKKGKNWLWALLAALLLIALVVFLMSRTGRADLDGEGRDTAGVAEGTATTAPADGMATGGTPGGAGTTVDSDGDGVPVGRE